MFTVIGKIKAVKSEGKKHQLVVGITDEFSVNVSYYNETAPEVGSGAIAQCRPVNLDKNLQDLELDAISLLPGVAEAGVFATILGTLGRDPEMKYFDSGKSVAKTSAAVRGNNKDSTIWLKLVAWQKTGETIANYLHKGSQGLFSGEVTRNTWTNKEGEIKVDYELNVKAFNFVGKKSNNESSYSAVASPAQGKEYIGDEDISF